MRRTHASAPTQDHNIMSAPSVEFWLDLASPYCYLSALRITPLAKATGVAVRWRPFLLGPIFRAQGWQDSPFNAQPAKRAYLWRDMARQADKYQLPFSPPSEFPRHARHATQLAMLAAATPWAAQFCQRLLTANFVHDQDIRQPDCLLAALHGLTAHAPRWLALARQSGIYHAANQRSEWAQQRGLFGAPTFWVGQEMFWGDDRLEDALAWAGRVGG